MRTAVKTAREVLNIFRAQRTPDQEIALIEFFELTEQERWELLFLGAIAAHHRADDAMEAAIKGRL